MRIDLKTLLLEYGCPSLDNVHEALIANCDLTFMQIRDRLYTKGRILYEDTENQVYVATIRTGVGNLHSAVLAMQLRGGKLMVAGFAKEGFIKQNLWEKALVTIKSLVEGNGQQKVKKKNKTAFLFIVLGIIIATCVIGGVVFASEVHQTIEATAKYNAAVENFNHQVETYNSSVALVAIDNIPELPTKLEPLTVESIDFWDNAKVLLGANSKAKILADADTVADMTEQAKSAVALVKQIAAPSAEWVADRLNTVAEITGTQTVTEELNPDGLLNKDGGYIACVYFTVKAINSEEILGDSIVAKGTDAGGAVEVYATLAEAEARCEYLAGFDGSVLYTGSYAVVGTMVVRTSYKLTNEEQLNLTADIANSFLLQSEN